MQPILMLAVVGVAAVALGTGFLSNDIDLWIQQFGVGSGDIMTPTDHILVDFDIQQIQHPTNPGFSNVVAGCELTLDDTIGQPLGPITVDGITFEVTKLSELTCKLTDREGNIIAEGTISQDIFAADVAHNVPVTPVPVVTDVHDVIVVAHANTYTAGEDPPVSP